jgi:hypothetical protein
MEFLALWHEPWVEAADLMNATTRFAPTMPKSPVQQIMQSPNVLGFAHCSDAGDVILQEGNEVDVLANVLVCFQQVATLIGAFFGLGNFQEAQIQGKSLTVICLPDNGGAAA